MSEKAPFHHRHPEESLIPNREAVGRDRDVPSAALAERHPDWPLISVSFYFSPHGNAYEMEGIGPYLERADVLLYENSRSDLTRGLQRIAAKDSDARPIEVMIGEGKIYGKPIQGSAWEPLLRGVYKSGKVIGSIDLNEDEQHIKDELVEPWSLPVGDNLDEALEGMGDMFRREAELQNQREAIMAAKFEEEIARILEENPELKEKPQLNVLVSVGAYHTRLRHNLREKGVPSERYFPESSYVYDYINQLTRTYAYGKEPSRELLEKTYLQTLIADAALNKLDDMPGRYKHDDLHAYLRRVTDAFSSEEIEQVYELFKKKVLSVPLLDGILSSKGLGRLTEALEQLLEKEQP